MVSIATAEQALKSYYLGTLNEILDFKVNPFLAMIEKSTRNIVGKDVRMTVKNGVNGGIGAGTETGNLPVSGGNNYSVLTTSLKNLYGTIEITDKAIRASQNNEGAFVDLLNADMEGVVRSSVFNFGRMLFGDGTGMLAIVQGVNSSIITVDSVANLQVGMIVDFRTSNGEEIAGANARTITQIDYDGKTICVSGTAITSTTCPAGTLIFMQGSYGLELTGLKAIFDMKRTELYGLNRAEHSWLNPVVKERETVDDIFIQQCMDEVEMRCGSKVDVILCSPGVRRALMARPCELKAYLNTLSAEVGYTELSVNGIPVIADRFCPEGTMYLLNSKDFALHQLCDWQWLEDEDGRVLKQIAGKAAYTATLVKYADLVCSRPCGQVMIQGITES